MANFCGNCGATLTGAFCNKCGARAPGPSAPVQAQPVTPVAAQPPAVPFQPVAVPAAPVATAGKGSGVGKILLIVGGVLLLLFVLGVGAAVYGVYWVKHKVTAYSAAVTGKSGDSIKVVEKGDSCRLLSTAELQQVLGVTIEKSAEVVEDSAPGCAYYTNPQAFAQLQRQAVAQAKRQSDEASKKPGPKTDNPLELLKDANQLEGVVKTLGLTQPDKDGRVFSFTVERNFGKDAWDGMRLTEAAIPGFEEVPGVGDHAMIGAFGHAFYVQKGDVMIHLDTTWVPETRTRGAVIGKKIIGNL